MDKVLLAVRYVDGELDELEHRAFEDAMRGDVELQEYFSYYKEINRNIGMQLKEALIFPKFKKADTEEIYVEEKLKSDLDYLWFLGWGLAIVLALLVWKPWKAELYEEFGLDRKIIASKLISAPYQGFEEAARFLEKRDYYEAKRIVSKSFTQNPEDFKLANYYAMLLIADNCLETGREVLYPFANTNSIYKYDAAYMLALSYLKSGDKEKCGYWLRLIDEKSSYYSQSVQLLNKLNLDDSKKSNFI